VVATTKSNLPSDEAFTFTVTQVIGTVTVDPYGEGPSPYHAAMQVIAESDMEGTFQFPRLDGICEVTIEFKPNTWNERMGNV
jgi:hypothetical protein